MPERKPTVTPLSSNVAKVVWTGIVQGDTCAALSLPYYSDKTITAKGTWGGATITMQDADGVSLNDSRGEGNTMTFTVNDTKVLNENPGAIVPVLGGGNGTTDLTVTAICSR